jgi:tetratricopeptide (TPR) repeat protein
LTGLLDKLS